MKIYNIECKTNICESKTQKYILSAVDFLCSNANVDKLCFDLLCLVSKNFLRDINSYHGETQNDNNGNAIFIPTFFQKNTDRKDIIIINWKKIEEKQYDEDFIISIFIHEFSHFIDYRLCPILEKRYSIHFSLDIKFDSCDDIIFGLFQMQSEMRAKYFQEKYECMVNNSKENIIRHINEYAAQLNSMDDTYNIAHLTGQFLCWKEFAGDDDDILSALHFVETQLNLIWELRPDYRIDNLFTKESFIDKCNELYKIFTNK